MIEGLGQAQIAARPPKNLVAAARQFEAVFLSQMLSAAGAGKPAATFGGGTGEGQFASFLLDAQAQRIADAGGIGLAEMIIRHYDAASPEASA
jgi:Rod binding domain-containing protein